MKLNHQVGEAALLRGRRRGLLRVGGATALALAAIADLLLGSALGSNPWPVLPVLVLGVAMVLCPADRFPAWLSLPLRACAPALASGSLTVAVVLGASREVGCAPGETAVLLWLLLHAVRTCPPRWAVVCAVLNGAAAAALPLRYYVGEPGSGCLVARVIVALVMAAGCVTALGCYLRSLDGRRVRAVIDNRRTERVAMAADLHDFVAHHVTGILVQTQMARMLTPEDPQRLDQVLAGVEQAAAEALKSMRRMVGVLREDEGATGPRRGDRDPVGTLSALAGLTFRFAGPHGQKAVLHRSCAVPDDLPPEVQAAAYRVVQESLTNVLRHAADAAEVVIEVGLAGEDLRVSVRDNGRGGTCPSAVGLGGGFGLAGLAERVAALGGRLHAGPRPGYGWQVVALLPTSGLDTLFPQEEDRAWWTARPAQAPQAPTGSGAGGRPRAARPHRERTAPARRGRAVRDATGETAGG